MKRKPKHKTINNKLDRIWSRLIKARDKKCMYCKTRTNLQSHHIFSRSNRSVRWDTENGITLCASHHTFNQNFSAHQTPITFTYFLENLRGKQFVDDLTRKAHSIKKWTIEEKQELYEQLKKQFDDINIDK